MYKAWLFFSLSCFYLKSFAETIILTSRSQKPEDIIFALTVKEDPKDTMYEISQDLRDTIYSFFTDNSFDPPVRKKTQYTHQNIEKISEEFVFLHINKLVQNALYKSAYTQTMYSELSRILQSNPKIRMKKDKDQMTLYHRLAITQTPYHKKFLETKNFDPASIANIQSAAKQFAPLFEHKEASPLPPETQKHLKKMGVEAQGSYTVSDLVILINESFTKYNDQERVQIKRFAEALKEIGKHTT